MVGVLMARSDRRETMADSLPVKLGKRCLVWNTGKQNLEKILGSDVTERIVKGFAEAGIQRQALLYRNMPCVNNPGTAVGAAVEK